MMRGRDFLRYSNSLSWFLDTLIWSVFPSSSLWVIAAADCRFLLPSDLSPPNKLVGGGSYKTDFLLLSHGGATLDWWMNESVEGREGRRLGEPWMRHDDWKDGRRRWSKYTKDRFFKNVFLLTWNIISSDLSTHRFMDRDGGWILYNNVNHHEESKLNINWSDEWKEEENQKRRWRRNFILKSGPARQSVRS